MRGLTKEDSNHDLLPSTVERRWEMFMPVSTVEPEAEEVTVALRQAQLVIRAQEERIHYLEQMTLTDELTGLTNRRGFSVAFERELALARRNADYGGVLVMIDLDGFKTINDRWGHQVGDNYLCTVANVLRQALRASDVVARLGGDEFALLLTNMNEKNTAKRLVRLEQDFSRRAMPWHEPIMLRASFGYAAYSGNDKAEAIIQSADLRLYAHKSRHKNMVMAD